jgi:2-dehydropantoate 2-reductase
MSHLIERPYLHRADALLEQVSRELAGGVLEPFEVLVRATRACGPQHASALRLGVGCIAAWTAGLQNGLLAGDVLAEIFGSQRVAGACTVLGARRADDGTVLASLGRTYFGEFADGRADRTEAAASAFNAAGLPCEATADIGSVLWAKMCNAVGVFGVSALTGLPTSQIMSTGPLLRAYRALIEETALVANAAGITIADHPDLPMRSYLDQTPDAMVDRLTARPRPHDGGTPQDFSSMAQDLASGRPTEYEQIFGDLLRRAHDLGVQIPRVALVHDVVAGLDAAGRPAQLRPHPSGAST